MNRDGACLIAGCGDVGMRLGMQLCARGERVYGLRRNPTAIPAPMIAVQADLTDPASLAELPDDIDRLVYLPAPTGRDEAAYQQVFVAGLAHLIEALQRRNTLSRILFVSSSAVYGEHAGEWVDEETPCAPLAFNGQILLKAEASLHARGLPAVVARCSGLYGPGRTRLVEMVASGHAQVPSTKASFSNRIHVEDAASALAHLMVLPSPSSCYLLSDDEPAVLADVYTWIAGQLGVDPPQIRHTAGERAVGNKRLSNRRLRQTGFSFRYPDFRSGYQELIRSQHLQA
ncbi:MAG: SDR family oxidoreductase [Tahibacter sp.]